MHSLHYVASESFWRGLLTRVQVIAVPAHFNDKQQQATLTAAKLAGLEEVQLLQGGSHPVFVLNLQMCLLSFTRHEH